jgi:hypothetical protein
MSTKPSLRAALERPVSGTARSPAPSGFPAARFALSARQIAQPIDVATTLRQHGMSLRKAHDTLNRLARGERVAVALSCNPSALVAELATLGVDAVAVRTP